MAHIDIQKHLNKFSSENLCCDSILHQEIFSNIVKVEFSKFAICAYFISMGPSVHADNEYKNAL